VTRKAKRVVKTGDLLVMQQAVAAQTMTWSGVRSRVVSVWRVHPDPEHGGPSPANDEPLRRLESL